MSISEQAKQGVDFIFTKAAKANLVVDAGDEMRIEALPGSKFIEPPEKHLLILTISSYLFRLLTIFHIDSDKATQDYFTKSDSNRNFEEVFSEMGNLCCGAMNRDFGNYFPHLGMSTPFMLESKCVPFFKELKPNYISQHKLTINDSIKLHATLCFCSYAPIDFRVDMSVAAEETGALELF